MRKFLLFFLCLIGALLAHTLLIEKTYALSGFEFQAGRIIDDGQFFNGNGLTTDQIQLFLNSKVPTCDSSHPKSSSPNDSGPPYICLKDYQQYTWNISPDSYCNGFSAGNKSAAQIIYEVGISCGINQKVILVTLQKEQSLVTDTWPWQIQYDHATGYACPDTAPCDLNFEGFFRQVYYGARQFKRYSQDINIFSAYRPYRQNRIQYNPNTVCGGADIYIQNQATAGLYTYTPYQPNAAALNNLYGTGDDCSAYGNRNFWRMYNDWFGTTYAGPFVARIVEHTPNFTLRPGRTNSVYVRFKNVGTDIWFDDIAAAVEPGRKPVRLSTDNPLNRISVLSSSWQYPHRPGINFSKVYDTNGNLSSDQHQAFPGETVEFWYRYTALHGTPPGQYIEAFRPIVEGLGPMNDTGTYMVIDVPQVTYTAQFYSQTAITPVTQGDKISTSISFRNTGNATWHDEVSAPGSGELPVHLATDHQLNRNSIFSSEWPFPHRAATTFSAVYEADGTTLAADQHKVAPGQIGKFSFNFKTNVNTSPDLYRESFRPVVQGLGPMNDTGTWLGVNVQKRVYSAQYSSQSDHATASRSGASVPMFISYKNTGNTTWHDEVSAPGSGELPVHLATDYELNRNSIFGSEWPFPHRAAVAFSAVYEANGTTLAADQHKVAPGQIGKFSFSVRATPSTPIGFYNEPIRPVIQGLGPMNDTGTWLGVNVVP